jgi:choline dehydrogenase-like flavoprotein
MSLDCDVLVVGSGPVGTAVARELADRDPSLRVVVLEAGRPLGEVAGGHVKNIADTEERDRLLAALATGPAPLPGGTPARPGTVLLGAAAMPNAAMSTNVGGMGAHWTAACPRPVDDEVPGCVDPALLDEALTRA